MIKKTAIKCRFCGEELYEDEDYPRQKQRGQGVEATEFLIPTNVSGWSIVSCYLGLIGFCLPLVGLVFAIPAFICGIVALRKRKRTKAASYGSVTSDVRAIIGLVLSGLAILGWGGLALLLLTRTIK
jgi:hypothetical protein